MFDEVFMPYGKYTFDQIGLERDLAKSTLSLEDYEYLSEKGVFVQNPLDGELLVDTAHRQVCEYNDAHGGNSPHTKEVFTNYLERFSVEQLSVNSSDIFIPASEFSSKINNYSSASVCTLLIENLPIISEDVPLDEVLSFRAEHITDFKELVQWISELDDEKSFIDNDRLMVMIESFRKYQRIGELKFKPGKVELVFQCLAQFQDAFKRDFGKVSKTLASVRKDKANLIEHEMNNPNRPLSYIVKAQDHFK